MEFVKIKIITLFAFSPGSTPPPHFFLLKPLIFPSPPLHSSTVEDDDALCSGKFEKLTPKTTRKKEKNSLHKLKKKVFVFGFLVRNKNDPVEANALPP